MKVFTFPVFPWHDQKSNNFHMRIHLEKLCTKKPQKYLVFYIQSTKNFILWVQQAALRFICCYYASRVDYKSFLFQTNVKHERILCWSFHRILNIVFALNSCSSFEKPCSLKNFNELIKVFAFFNWVARGPLILVVIKLPKLWQKINFCKNFSCTINRTNWPFSKDKFHLFHLEFSMLNSVH